MLKMSDNPPVLFPEDSALERAEGRWWVAHTKARNEKALAWVLAKQEIGYFLPLQEQVGVRRGKKCKSVLPLFSGYVFFCGGPEERLAALKSNRIAQVIEVLDQGRLKTELTRINRALSSGKSISPHAYLQAGTRCRVTAGALAGLEGQVVRGASKCQLVLAVSMLGQAAAVEIDGDLLEPIEN